MRSYPEYKDSGVECIGEIPKEWEITRLVSIGDFSKGRNITKDELRETGYPCIVYSQLYTVYERLVKSVISFIDDDKFKETTRVDPGTFLFTSSGETIEEIGKCVLYDGDSKVSVGGDMVIFNIGEKREFDRYFLSYVFNSGFFQHQKSANSRGDIVVHVYERQLRDMRFTIPPLYEQKHISNYLDQKTLNIDGLIEKTKRKIELLKEKRASIISQCVTKGLDPNVEMKDSGVAWIGEIPENWELKKLKYISKITYGISPPETSYNDVEEGTVLINGPVEYSTTDFGFTRSIKWTTEPKNMVPKGSLLFCVRGSTTGRMNICHQDVSIGRGVCAIQSKFDQNFTVFCMMMIRIYIQDQISGSTFPSVVKEDVDNFVLPWPPEKEQKKISGYIKGKVDMVNGLINLHAKKLDYLREYRQSLISSVVTGKMRITEDMV